MFPSLAPVLLALAAPTAQIDPPHDGTYTTYRDQIVTYSDFYRTYADVRIPNSPPGPQGWPLILVVHGTGTSRARVEFTAEAYAERGFVTLSYDVRGQGPGMSLNDPRFYGREILGTRERVDLFEMIEAIEAQFPDAIDLNRIGVTGKSQGAVHCWFAAAHGGELPPPNPWRTARFPEIAAIAPINFGTDFLEAMVPGDQAFAEMTARQFYEDEAVSGIHINPAVYALLEPFVASEDYQGFVDQLYDPSLDLDLLLRDCDTAVLASMAYDDKYASLNRMIPGWEALFSQAPFKAMAWTTGGHSTPVNALEDERREFRRVQFFEESLKGISHGVADWPAYLFAIAPVDAVDYARTDSVWSVFESPSPELPGSRTETLHLTGDTLQRKHPGQPEVQRLQHRHRGVSFRDYALLLPPPDDLMQAIPLERLSFRTAPLQQDALLLGTPRVRLHLASDDLEYQLTAALYEEQSGRYLCSGTATVRDNANAGEQTLDLDLGTIGVFVPAGTRLRLILENLAWHAPAEQQHTLRALPIFADYEIDFRLGGNDPARLELPVVDLDRPLVTADAVAFGRYQTGQMKLAVRGFDDQRGWTYQLLASLSGTEPGTSYGGLFLPINVDPLTELILKQPGALPLTGFSGKLDANGEAWAEIDFDAIGPIPAVAQTLSFCAVLAPPGQQAYQVSPAVVLPRID